MGLKKGIENVVLNSLSAECYFGKIAVEVVCMLNRFINWADHAGDNLYLLCNETRKKLETDDVKGISPGIAFYFIVGFIPFLIFLVNVILFFTVARLDIVIDMLYAYLPVKVALTLEADIQRVVAQRSDLWLWMGLLASMMSFQQGLAVLVRATDREHYESADNAERARKLTFLVHGKAVVFSVGLIVAIILSLGLLVFGEAMVQILCQVFPLPELFIRTWDWIKYVLPFVSLIVYLTIFYIFAPRANHPAVPAALVVSIFVTVAWLAATGVYSWFMMVIPSIGEAYGPLMGLFVLFLWFRWIAYIIIIGICSLKVWQERKALWEKYKSQGIIL